MLNKFKNCPICNNNEFKANLDGYYECQETPLIQSYDYKNHYAFNNAWEYISFNKYVLEFRENAFVIYENLYKNNLVFAQKRIHWINSNLLYKDIDIFNIDTYIEDLINNYNILT